MTKQAIEHPVPFWEMAPKNLSWTEKADYLAYYLKAWLKSQGIPEPETPVEHSFEPGWYIRTMKIPAGTILLGRIHRKGHECILKEGIAVYVAPEAKYLIKAPFSLTTPPGYRAIVYAITDCIGITRHINLTDSRDIEALELEAFEPADDSLHRGKVIMNRMKYQKLEHPALEAL